MDTTDKIAARMRDKLHERDRDRRKEAWVVIALLALAGGGWLIATAGRALLQLLWAAGY